MPPPDPVPYHTANDQQTSHTFLFAVPCSTTLLPSIERPRSDKTDGDRLILTLVSIRRPRSSTADSSTFVQKQNAANGFMGWRVTSLTGERNLVLMPRELPDYLYGVWCTGVTHDYLVYPLHRSPQQLIEHIQSVLAQPAQYLAATHQHLTKLEPDSLKEEALPPLT
jgi:hypothetical protein